MPVSRRHFLQAAGAGAAVWVPSPVKGYSATELTRRAETSGATINELGVSVWDLDTPALVVDLDVLEANIATMQRTVARNGIASRLMQKRTRHLRSHACSSRPGQWVFALPRLVKRTLFLSMGLSPS